MVPAARARRGRPRTNDPAQTETVFHAQLSVAPDLQAQSRVARAHGLYVLITSRSPDLTTEHPAKELATRVLHEYRGQHQVEAGFRWIKGTAHVAPLLLHTPARIEALAFVFTIALMVYRLIQWRIREALATSNMTIPGHNRVPTSKPTTLVVMRLFTEIYRIWMDGPSGRQFRLVGFKPVHRQILQLLGLPPDLYHHPRNILSSS
jgi:transposase